MNLYTIIFEDNSVYQGGDLVNTLWANIPDKPIKKFTYYVPNTKQIICEENFLRVYHYVEVTQDIHQGNKGAVNLEYSYLIFEKEFEYEGYRINLQTKKIENLLLKKDNEYVKSLNPMGWKKGGK